MDIQATVHNIAILAMSMEENDVGNALTRIHATFAQNAYSNAACVLLESVREEVEGDPSQWEKLMNGHKEIEMFDLNDGEQYIESITIN